MTICEGWKIEYKINTSKKSELKTTGQQAPESRENASILF